jgi:hypothetical protein
MTKFATLEAAAHDPLPGLLASLELDYPGSANAAFAARIMASEAADFHWDAQVGARKLGVVEALEDGSEARECWQVLGYLAGQWFVAKLLLDGDGRPRDLVEVRRFGSAWDAHAAFD